MQNRRKEERQTQLTLELSDIQLSGAQLCSVVSLVVELEYRKERHGAWVLDDERSSKKFLRWRCTACGHWQSSRRNDRSDQIFYMNYCPFCGSQMDKPERERDFGI